MYTNIIAVKYNYKLSAFNEMDENHDGQVSEEEFIEVGYSFSIKNGCIWRNAFK